MTTRNQYSMNTPSNTSGGLLDLMQAFLEEKTKNIHTQLPAKVTAVDYNKGWVNVKPLIRSVVEQNYFSSKTTEVEYPEIFEVPIFQISAGRGKARVSMPIQVGDVGVLLFSERDTDLFLNSNGSSIQDSGNPHTLGQEGKPYPLAFVPEIFTASSNNKISPSDIVIENNGTKVTIKPDGSSYIENQAGSFKLESSGVVNINGLIINTDGSVISPVSFQAPSVTATTSLTVAGDEMSGHKHTAGTYVDAESRPITGESGTTV